MEEEEDDNDNDNDNNNSYDDDDDAQARPCSSDPQAPQAGPEPRILCPGSPTSTIIYSCIYGRLKKWCSAKHYHLNHTKNIPK